MTGQKVYHKEPGYEAISAGSNFLSGINKPLDHIGLELVKIDIPDVPASDYFRRSGTSSSFAVRRLVQCTWKTFSPFFGGSRTISPQVYHISQRELREVYDWRNFGTKARTRPA